MKRVLYLVVVFLAAMAGRAGGTPPPVYFADPNLKACVEAELGISDPTATDMQGLIWLDASFEGITDLTGLEDANNLTELYLSFNSITDLSPIAGLSSLTDLDLSKNNITDINDLSGLTNLNYLSLWDNSITDISPLAGLTNLIGLDLDENAITDVNALSGLGNLEELYLFDNSITDISPLAGLNNLFILDLDENTITDINSLSGLSNLFELYLFDNNITDISPLAGLGDLTDLDLGYNNITDVNSLSGLTNLNYLSLWNNNVTDINSLAGLTNLIGLDLDENIITDINSLSGLSNLEELYLWSNNITDINSLSGLTNLVVLDLVDNNITDINSLSGLVNLEGLALGYNTITDINALSGLGGLIELYLFDNNITDISPLVGYTNLDVLWVDGNPLNNEAYCTHLPAIIADNPWAWIFYDENTNPPGNVSASDGTHSDKVEISWDAVCSVTGDTYYRAYRSDSEAGAKTALGADWQTGTSYDDTTATAGTWYYHPTYYYWLKAKTQNGDGIYEETDYSLYDTGWRSEPVVIPTVITHTAINVTKTSATLRGSIDDDGGEPCQYRFIYRRSDESRAHVTEWKGSVTDGQSFSETISGLRPGSLYYFRAWARNSAGEGHWGNEQSFTTLTTIYVDDNAPADPGPNDSAVSDPCEDGSSEHPFDKIAEAVDVAVDGEVVIVRGGIYYETIDYAGKGITVRGFEPNMPAVVSHAIIDANGLGTVVTFNNGEGSDSVLSGFVLTGGNGEYGGAIYCEGSSPTISNCLIVGNRAADANGAALYCMDSNGVFTNCTVSGNYGGESGSALFFDNCNATVSNSIIWGNTPYEIITGAGADPDITYSDIAGGWLDTGNIDDDPCFVEAGYWADANDPNLALGPDDPNSVWVAGDYHLLSGSPCIDTGDPNHVVDIGEVDIDSELRIIQGRIDMGADEYVDCGLCDLNDDDNIDFVDYGILAYYWMGQVCGGPGWCEGGDFDKSGGVDFIDMVTFAECWLRQADLAIP